MFNHDGNGIQLVGSSQTDDVESGVYDAVIRNLGIWCVPDNNKEGLRPTTKATALHSPQPHRIAACRAVNG